MSEQNPFRQNMHDTLCRTVRHVVETMCFSELAPSEKTWQTADIIVTGVNFYGSRSGRLELEVSSSAAWSLRTAFLGTCEQERSADTGADASASQIVGELGTMICGRFLSAVDPLSKMSLASPEVDHASGRAGEQTHKRLQQGFLLESGHLTASVEFDHDQLD